MSTLIRSGSAVLFAVIVLWGCSAAPAPKPSDSQNAGIGILVTIRAPISMFTVRPTRIYFVRVDGGIDPYLQKNLIVSNFAREGYVYLLDILPGRYAAVAAGSDATAPGARGQLFTVFPREVIELTDTMTAPGTVMFAGEYVLDTAGGFAAADDTQMHYFSVFEPGAAYIGPIMGSKFYYVGSLRESRHDSDSERRFLDNAREHLGAGGWTVTDRRAVQQPGGSHEP